MSAQGSIHTTNASTAAAGHELHPGALREERDHRHGDDHGDERQHAERPPGRHAPEQHEHRPAGKLALERGKRRRARAVLRPALKSDAHGVSLPRMPSPGGSGAANMRYLRQREGGHPESEDEQRQVRASEHVGKAMPAPSDTPCRRRTEPSRTTSRPARRLRHPRSPSFSASVCAKNHTELSSMYPSAATTNQRSPQRGTRRSRGGTAGAAPHRRRGRATRRPGSAGPVNRASWPSAESRA